MSVAAEFERLGNLIRQLQGALDGKVYRSGFTSVTFTASASSAAATVTHGLGGAPSSITLTCSTTNDFRAAYSNVTSTTFDVKAFTNAAVTGPLDVSWQATR